MASLAIIPEGWETKSGRVCSLVPKATTFTPRFSSINKIARDSERKIELLSAKIEALELKLADPVIYDMDGSEVETILKHLGSAKKALADAEVVWLEAQEFLEAASD